MRSFYRKKTGVILLLLITIAVSQSFTPEKEEHKEKAKNLKVLPKNIAHDDLIKLMKGYSKSLGVKCKHCHVAPVGDPPKTDFASDANPKKAIARKMILMTNAINKKYIGRINAHLNHVACVTCHMGSISPTVSLDSLKTENKHE